MGLLFVVFAASMAVATFIENDYGSATAYGSVYGTKWFELILLLLAVNLVGQLIAFKLFKRERITGALFHLAFIVMLAGAAITRYTGWEGSIHIREGEEQDKVYSTQKFLGYTVTDNSGSVLAQDSEDFTSATSRGYRKSIPAGNRKIDLALTRMVPNASEEIVEDPQGEPYVSLFFASTSMHGQTYFLKRGEVVTEGQVSVSFEAGDTADLNIRVDSGKFYAVSRAVISETSMKTKSSLQLEPGKPFELRELQILSMGNINVIPRQLLLTASVGPVAVNPEERNTGQNAFIFDVRSGNESDRIYLWDKSDSDVSTAEGTIGGNIVSVRFGPEVRELPFSIRLNDFILERYPGSSSPSGYKSDVILSDPAGNVQMPFMIFMNNILKYKGYRFYQSSYDPDEKGTILSVNHDIAGMMVTYAGYALLFLFIILSLINRNAVFHRVTSGYWNSALRKTVPAILLLILTGLIPAYGQKLVPDKAVSEEFGKMLVQDQKGRTKPLYTVSSDILRKVARENKFEGMSPMQVFLGIYLDFNSWKDVPVISISNKELKQKLGITGNMAAFSDLVDLSKNGAYKISDDVSTAYSKSPSQRNRYDKEVMKIDERVNILYMVYNGSFMRIFPLRDQTHEWASPSDANKSAASSEDSLLVNSFIPVLVSAIEKQSVNDVALLRNTISEYQEKHSDYELPGKGETNAELLYYRMNIFEKLFPFYATLGLLMLIGLIAGVIRGIKGKSLFIKAASALLLVGFLFHTIGLGLRWYISGHSPMSNGYESMLFISWVTLLAGFIFSRKSSFALSATAVLASMTLMVAHLSFMDPEITNLVPVLKSYWLTLHVSVITGSYGFLGLGAILGLITLILLAMVNPSNREQISNTIDELTVINYKSLTLGLYLLTIGTFLGAVWANESWGRYWGWDPKETWSLITIIIYSIVVHSRFIPSMKDVYIFNLSSLVAFASVLMTYFGVNYYLSGLHSYASGDPVPVPSFVYITVIVLAILSFVAHSRYSKHKVK